MSVPGHRICEELADAEPGFARVTRVFLFVAAHPGWCLLLSALLFAGSVLALARHAGPRVLAIDASIAALLPRDGADREVYERVKQRFGDDDVLLVVWSSPRLFTADGLARLKRYTAGLEHLPGVTRVDSLASAPNVRTADGVIDVDPFLRRVPKSDAAAAALADAALANPLYRGTLVAADKSSTLVAIATEPGLLPAAQQALVTAVERLTAEHAGDIAHYVTGPAYARVAIASLLSRDLMVVMPVAVAVTLLVAFLGMRTLRALVLPLVATGGAVLVAVTLFLALGYSFNFVTVIVPPVIFIVGFAYAIHLVTSFDEAIARGLDKAAAAEAALLEALGPVTLNALLEAIGFASLGLSAVPAIRAFGYFSALGVVASWASAMVLVPAGLQLLPVRRLSGPPRLSLVALAPKLARFDLGHRRAILAAVAVLTLAAALAATRIDVGTDYLRVLPASSPIPGDFERLSATFQGAVPVEIVLETDVPANFRDPAQLELVAGLADWLRAQPGVGGVVTLADYLGVLHHALVPDAPAARLVPKSKQLVDQLLLLGAGNDVDRFADPRFRTTVLRVRSTAVATRELAALVERIEAHLATLPGHLRGHVTGSAVMLARSIDAISAGQIASFATTALTIYVVLALLFGSLRAGALALLPNVLPIVMFFGILGLTGIPLDFTTSLVAPIVLGIVMDDTVHFLSRFNLEARRAADEQRGAERAMASTIRPVAFATVGLTVGFLALGVSELRNQVQFGMLAAATMLIAWGLDLVFTPALTSHMRFVTLWEALTIDLGCRAPHRTIPLFEGLTERQARTAALHGAIEAYPAGARIAAEGDPAHEIIVVLEGEILATIPRAEGDATIRRFGRGELIGAATLFHGRHFANLDAVSAVRALRLGEAALDRLRRFYPWIAAPLYRNLSAIMARRIAELAVRV
ncbi:MAG: MMPL family transporter [Gammaproteobacteria bacterium]|nr:MMPL family transporter [Gammaproteobacteria bacterium]MBI5616001.1 MMPL family transporter [Gammaproteobacteria bacterium]